jgi:hypothetical protein
MAKGNKTGGRQKGTKNKASVKRAEEIAETGETPLEYMIRVMRSSDADYDRRDKMAAAAAPYVHPKLANIEHTGKDQGPIETLNLSEIELGRRLAFLLAKAKRALS